MGRRKEHGCEQYIPRIIGTAAPSHLLALLKLDNLLEHMFEDMLAVALVSGQLQTHPQDVSALAHVVLEVILPALVGELRQSHALRRETIVEVEEIERGGGGFAEVGREHGGLEGGKWRFKLRGDEAQRFVLNAERVVRGQRVRHHRRVDVECIAIEQRREVAGNLLHVGMAARAAAPSDTEITVASQTTYQASWNQRLRTSPHKNDIIDNRTHITRVHADPPHTSTHQRDGDGDKMTSEQTPCTHAAVGTQE